jgi:hypothetical protein
VSSTGALSLGPSIETADGGKLTKQVFIRQTLVALLGTIVGS